MALDVETQYQGNTVYTRGALTLHALGDDAFFRTLKAFTKRFGGGGRVDRRLHLDRRARVGPAADDYFDVCLYEPGKPASW